MRGGNLYGRWRHDSDLMVRGQRLRLRFSLPGEGWGFRQCSPRHLSPTGPTILDRFGRGREHTAQPETIHLHDSRPEYRGDAGIDGSLRP